MVIVAPPDARESRPVGSNRTASAIPTPIKIKPDTTGSGCRSQGHRLPSCPIHGDPQAAVDSFPYVDPAASLPLSDLQSIEHLVDAYADEFSCVICSEILVHDYWAQYPGAECEATCTVQHCTVCGLCGRSGLVCRECGVCVSDEEQGATLTCWSTRWSRARRREVEFYSHDLWNPLTGRWGA